MTPSRHILLTTDLSDESQLAFEPVARLALELRARVTLLCIVHDQIYFSGPEAAGVPTQMTPEAAASAMTDELRRLRLQLPEQLEVTVASEVGGDDVGRTIAEYARSHAVDFIAMASHGRSGARRLFVGSVAESVLRHTMVPMWIYPLASLTGAT